MLEKERAKENASASFVERKFTRKWNIFTI